MNLKKVVGAALAGALAVTAFAPSPAEASPGACVGIYGPNTEGCSFRQTGSKTLNYNVVVEGNILSEPSWQVGMCTYATYECVTKNAWFDPAAGTVTNTACLTQECYAFVRLGWIDSLAYIYTV